MTPIPTTPATPTSPLVAVLTGASQGLGLALAHDLAASGWTLVLDARRATPLAQAARSLPGGPHPAVAGDVADPDHRQELVDVAAELGGAALLVNNASTLGRSPLPTLAELDDTTYRRVLEVNLLAPVALAAAVLSQLREHHGTVVNVSSDAAVEAYPTWGGYGSAKAGLDHATAVLAAEEPGLRVYALDPGDLRTALHQAAFPGEDISDRPEPASVVPAFRTLLAGGLPSGRYRAADLLAEAVA